MTNQPDKTQRGGLRVLGELVLIIVGVLIALSAEALWQDRQDRARAAEYVDALKTDMESSDLAIAATLGAYDDLVAHNRRVIEWIEGGARPDSGLVGVFANPGFPVVRRGALDALVETGDVSFLEDDLRVAIVQAHGGLTRLDDVGGILYEERRGIQADFVREWQRALGDEPVSPTSEAARVATNSDLVATYRLILDNTLLNRSILESQRRIIANLLSAIADA